MDPQKPSYFSGLRCSQCDSSYDPDTVQTTCQKCGGVLLPEYDLDALRGRRRPRFRGRDKSLWRYRELLPVRGEPISLGEGFTPIIRAHHLEKHLGLKSLYIKDESGNPTGSFKARGMAVAISRAKELKISTVVLPSAGNAGGAAAAYAAAAGMPCIVFLPKDAPETNQRECIAFGAKMFLVDGLINDAGRLTELVARRTGAFNLSTFKEPYRVEGKKAMGLEIAEQFGWRLPDVIVYPTGGGTGLVGIWKAVRELETLGWVKGPRPRMISVQAEGCAPIVRAFQEGKTKADAPASAHTLASGLRVPRPFADSLILGVLRESNGTAIAVSDDLILEYVSVGSALTGVGFCPEGAATLAALPRLLEQNDIEPSDKVLVINTGSSQKYPFPSLPALKVLSADDELPSDLLNAEQTQGVTLRS